MLDLYMYNIITYTNHNNYVYVQPCPSAVNITLPAFAAAVPLLLSASACYQIYLLTTGCSAANPLHAAAAIDQWDRQLDGWMDGQIDGHLTSS